MGLSISLRRAPNDYLIVDGKRVLVDFPVFTYQHPRGLSFNDHPVWNPRLDPTGGSVNLLVLHWDECRSSRDCYDILLERGLSAHLLVDYDGTVYQTLDLARAKAWHARDANERSIGMEINNPVYLDRSSPKQPERATVTEVLPHTDREWVHLDFSPSQKDTLSKLVPKLCQIFNIPTRLPEEKGTVPTTTIDPGFTGVCGHYHLQKDKVDPGLTLWPVLAEALQSELE